MGKKPKDAPHLQESHEDDAPFQVFRDLASHVVSVSKKETDRLEQDDRGQGEESHSSNPA